MSFLETSRIIRKTFGLPAGAEYPNLETLLENECDQPHSDFKLLSYVIPPVIALTGLLPLAFSRAPLAWVMALVCVGVSIGTWFVLKRFDKLTPPSKQKIRMLAELLSQRVQGFASVVGARPAISPAVANLLEEAAAIYLRHQRPLDNATVAELRSRDELIAALEGAVARLLELAKPESLVMQEHELAAGWAEPLMEELRRADVRLKSLEEKYQTSSEAPNTDPLARLRESGREFDRVEEAVSELRQL